MSSIRNTSRIAALSVVSAALLGTVAQAGGVIFDYTVDGVGGPFSPPGTPIMGGGTNFQGDLFDISGSLSWDLNTNPDPLISGNIVIVNTDVVAHVYSLTITLPSIAIPGGTLIGGSVAGGLTTDIGGGSLTDAGGPVWTALIDGVAVHTLLNNPFVVSDTGANSVPIPGESFGLPIPSDAGPAVTTSIGIKLTFILTPGDQASFTSVFLVKPVPAPAGLALLGLAGLAGGRRRRSA